MIRYEVSYQFNGVMKTTTVRASDAAAALGLVLDTVDFDATGAFRVCAEGIATEHQPVRLCPTLPAGVMGAFERGLREKR